MLISIGQPKTAATRINDLPASTAVLPLIEITGFLAFISLAADSLIDNFAISLVFSPNK